MVQKPKGVKHGDRRKAQVVAQLPQARAKVVPWAAAAVL